MLINTQYFRSPALYFEKHGKYPCGIRGSNEYKKWWLQEREYCLYGISVGGMWIPGYYYYYLNYCPIQVVQKIGEKSGVRKLGFPKFWDLDYMFFMSVHIAKYGITKERLHKLPYSIPIKDDFENLAGGHHLIFLKPRGCGAEQPDTEVVITPYGEITMGEVKVETELYDKNGEITTVTEVLPQGYKEVWEVELLDGRKVKCGANHLWTIDNNYKEKTLTTREILENGLLYYQKTGQKTYKYKLPKLKPVKFPEKELPIHPYIVGAMLGNGAMTGHNLRVATDDIELVDRFSKILGKDYKLTKDPTNNNYLIGIVDRNKHVNEKEYHNSKYGINPLNREFDKLGLKIKCHDKFIPDLYKYASIKQRVELVKGLMDTGGSITKKGYCEFSNTSKKLINDLAYVLRSLGLYCSISWSEPRGIEKKINGQSIADNGYWRLYIATNKNIFYIPRKKERINKKKFTKTKVPIVSIRNTGLYEKQSCIIVDNKDSLYLTRDFIITHNSFKNGSMASRNFHLYNESKTYMFAHDKEYLTKDGIFSKFQEYRSWINTNAKGFASSSDFKADQNAMHFRNTYDDGEGNEEGLRSEVIGVTVNNKPDKGRGKRGILMLFEEAGRFAKMDEVWNICRRSVEENGIVYGTMIGFGTGGTEGSDFSSMETMFNAPRSYNILAFNNEWDIGLDGEDCGMFIPAIYSVQYTDKEGNSDLDIGDQLITKEIEKAEMSPDVTLVSRTKAELPRTPREAMLNTATNKFAREELVSWRDKLFANKNYSKYGTPKRLEIDSSNGQIVAYLETIKKPITTYPHKRGTDLDGCVVEYTTPYKSKDGIIPDSLYYACHDPYADEDAQDTTSLGVVYIMEQVNIYTKSKGDRIVASYIGRPKSLDKFNYTMFLLLRRWNARLGYENDRGNAVLDYAKRFKLVEWLEPEFELAWDDKITVKNKSTYKYGMRMGTGKNNTRILTGNIYLHDWLFMERGETENGEIKYNFHYIYDVALLDELRFYDGVKNADRMSALRIGMYYQRELLYDERVPIEKKKKHNSFDKFMEECY